MTGVVTVKVSETDTNVTILDKFLDVELLMKAITKQSYPHRSATAG